VSTGTSYRLSVTAEHLDLLAFQDEAGRAQAAQSSQDAAAACDLYEQALRLWRGDPLADVDRLRRHPAVIGLYRQRSAVIVAHAEAACTARLYNQVLPHLRPLTLREPLHERAHALLMIALAGTGRQAAALKVFEDLRHRLDEQLAVRPCAELADAHQRVLRQQIPAAREPPAEPAPAIRLIRAGRATPERAVPRQLPPAIRHFAGRSGELTALTGLMERAMRSGATVVISAIGGPGGVGKTALALHWAHQVAGHFPDGQLYVNLRGFAPDGEPLPSADALRGFLDALQVPAERTPARLEAGAALYRSLLVGRRVLIMLDNARDAEQVRPLLPGSPGCLVLVTSRSRLTGLVAKNGAHPLMLDVLGENDARELLTRRLGPDRVVAEPQAAGDIVMLCARLPLALSIVAARAAVRPCLPLWVLADELRNPRTRLDALDTEEAATSVRAVFCWSFQQLSVPAVRMFGLLGVHPGPDISVPAAASLAGVPVCAARAALDQLARIGLLAEHAYGRFAFHDLLRAYAAEQACANESDATRRAAAHRMLDHYLHTACRAAVLLCPARQPLRLVPPRPGAVPEAIGDDKHALAWLEAEHRVLLAVMALAVGSGFHDAWRLPWTLVTFFQRGHWRDYAASQLTALEVAQRLDDLAGQACAFRRLGRAYGLLGWHKDAHACMRHALDFYRQLGDAVGQARTRLALAWGIRTAQLRRRTAPGTQSPRAVPRGSRRTRARQRAHHHRLVSR